MKGTYFDPVFKYGGKFGIVDSLTSRVRIVAGFLEPMVSDEMIGGVRGKTGPEHRGKYRLLLPAGEDFNIRPVPKDRSRWWRPLAKRSLLLPLQTSLHTDWS